MTARRRDQEDGVVLVLALVFVAFTGVLALGVLNFATTKSLATTQLRPLRAQQAAADGAIEGAINKLRQFRPAERIGTGPWTSTAPCPTGFYTYSPVPGSEYTVDCSNAEVTPPAGSAPASRTVTFTACAGSTSCPAGSALVVARVQFAGEPPNVSATVKSWSVNR